MKLDRHPIIYGALVALALIPVACGGGGGGGTSGKNASSDLVLIDVSVASQTGVPINEIIAFEFSEDLDPDTVRADTTDLPIEFGILPVSQDEEALCGEKVRYVGDPVAAVIADDEQTATEALELIEVDYEPLPTIAGPDEALATAEPR